MEGEDEKSRKRDRESASEGSDLSFSTPQDKIKTKPSKKKTKTTEPIHESNEDTKVHAQLVELNKKIDAAFKKVEKSSKDMETKIEKALEKDKIFLKDLMRDVVIQMKNELLESVINQIEKLECKIFERDIENDKLKEQIKHMEREVEGQKDEVKKLQREIECFKEERLRQVNATEQYSRSNNIRISGLGENTNKEYETAEETSQKVIDLIKTELNIDIKMTDIDIAHRLKKTQKEKRDVIVKFNSRMVKLQILRKKKMLKGSGLFINEDLTQLNQMVFNCVRKKMPDEVDSAWTRNGTILYRSKAGTTREVKYEDFQHWIDLPWK